MPTRDVIVVGASAGGVEALKTLVSGLPEGFPAAVFVVLHVPAHGPSVLPRILSRAGPLEAVHPQNGQAFEPGKVYIAPPDHHLLLHPGRIRLARGPRENGHRPAADALFRSAARVYGRRVIGVVLSGALDDGTAGMVAVKRVGGLAVVQHPDDAMYDGMPQSVLNHVAADHCLPVADIPALLVRLVGEPLPEPPPEVPGMSPDSVREADMAELEPGAVHDPQRPGDPSVYGCPECGGVLWELRDGEVLRFRCRVGHAWSAETLFAEQADGLEAALWSAMRALEEQAVLARRMFERALGRHHTHVAEAYAIQEKDARAQAELVRRVLLNRRPDTPNGTPDPSAPRPTPIAPVAPPDGDS